jgi:hypothetical protein
MQKIYRNPPPLAPEIEAGVKEINAGLAEANGFALAGLKSTYAAIDRVISTVLPFLILSEPNEALRRVATPAPALREHYQRTHGGEWRKGDNPFGPTVKLAFAGCDVSPASLVQYAMLVPACIERHGGASATAMKQKYNSMEKTIELWIAAGGGYRRSQLAKERAAAKRAAAAAQDADDEAADAVDDDPEIDEAILEYQKLMKELEWHKQQATLLAQNWTTERERREAAERRAMDAEALAEEYRARWEIAEAKLAALTATPTDATEPLPKRKDNVVQVDFAPPPPQQQTEPDGGGVTPDAS